MRDQSRAVNEVLDGGVVNSYDALMRDHCRREMGDVSLRQSGPMSDVMASLAKVYRSAFD